MSITEPGREGKQNHLARPARVTQRVVRERQRIHAFPNDETHACVLRHKRYLQGMARISHPLEPASIRNGSRWFAAYDQAEKNRLVKNALLEKEHNRRSFFAFQYAMMVK